jgi:hypothetical protein
MTETFVCVCVWLIGIRLETKEKKSNYVAWHTSLYVTQKEGRIGQIYDIT